MKTLIIPDVHHRIKVAQAIIDKEKADQVVHLGDHQDNFGDGPEDTQRTAKWTRERLEAGDLILLGNHDLPYWFWNYAHDWNCGWTPEKHAAIQNIIPLEMRKKFRLWTSVDGWLLSHAGFFPPPALFGAMLTDKGQEIFLDETLWRGETHPIISAVGHSRGGPHARGGILWLDWDKEFLPNEQKQIVGHTPHTQPVFKTYRYDDAIKSWGLDTHMTHYGILQDGKLTIEKTPTYIK